MGLPLRETTEEPNEALIHSGGKSQHRNMCGIPKLEQGATALSRVDARPLQHSLRAKRSEV